MKKGSGNLGFMKKGQDLWLFEGLGSVMENLNPEP